MKENTPEAAEMRRAKLVAEEMLEPEQWIYLFFVRRHDWQDVRKDEMLGHTFVRGHGVVTAIERCKELGFYPDGPRILSSMVIAPTDFEDVVPPEYRDRMLDDAEFAVLHARHHEVTRDRLRAAHLERRRN